MLSETPASLEEECPPRFLSDSLCVIHTHLFSLQTSQKSRCPLVTPNSVSLKLNST